MLRVVLEGHEETLKVLEHAPRRITSALTFVEATRTLARAAGEGRISPKGWSDAREWLWRFETGCAVFPLDEAVLARAKEPFPVPWLRTLDALHLATALLWRASVEPVAMVSYDSRLRENAHQLGFDVLPASVL